MLPSAAQETVLKPYDVELVIFRVINPTGSPEDWALEEARLKQNLPLAPEAGQEADTSPPASIVDTAPVNVTTTVANDTSIQPLESARFKLTAIESTLKRSRSYQPLAHIGWWQPAFGRESPRPVGIESLVDSGTGIGGTVALTRGARLLHLQINLTYQAPDGQRYVLREQRTVRSGDKHYFDHPHFGVIALVTPK
jgi:hypothetical protein